MKFILAVVAFLAGAALATPVRHAPNRSILRRPGSSQDGFITSIRNLKTPKRVKFATQLETSSQLRQHRGGYQSPPNSPRIFDSVSPPKFSQLRQHRGGYQSPPNSPPIFDSVSPPKFRATAPTAEAKTQARGQARGRGRSASF
ncbi:hypothetical protein XA68_12555 [Ophiocordyceps unilateralis]|uniref:Uncharacterized protein n=1 Tax=Ophiocordyceps unilateralis TaxID=268505 RepID=A0A2A9PN76_OPHUN|nr:hypothetical protein XA68_12555 [Ophiocordyceps unilateralis]